MSDEARRDDGALGDSPPRRRRWLHYLIAIGGLVMIVAILGGVKAWQIKTLMAFGETMQQAGPPPEAVSTTIAKTANWKTTIDAVGSVTGAEGVTVNNEAPGIVSRIRFKSGDVVTRGQVLVELDSSTERAQLRAAQSRLDLAKVVAKRSRALLESSAIPREELDRAETALDTARGEVEALRSQIGHKTVRAPFDGRLGIRAVNVGQFLSPGTEITRLEALDELYVDFTVPQEQLARVRTGLLVRIELRDGSEPIAGTIAAIDPTVDRATRSVRLRATVPRNDALRSGMFVRVSVELPESANVLIVPTTAIVHAAYGDSVFTVEPKPPGTPGMTTTPDGKPVKIARQHFVRLGTSRGDFVVIEKGIPPGSEVVTAGAFKLRNGSAIIVDNTRAAQPQLDPHPANR